jgi:hypothetical protein
MKSRKTLIALGVTCTLGVGAAFAASTPYPVSVGDSAPWMQSERQTSMIPSDTRTHMGSTSSSAGGSVSGTVSDLNGGDQMRFSGTTHDDGATLALADEGVYSDFYTVSRVPVQEQWDYYLISPTSSEDVYVMSPVSLSDALYVLSPGSYSVMTFYPGPSFDAEAGAWGEPAPAM